MHDPLAYVAAALFLLVCTGALVVGLTWTGVLLKVVMILTHRPTARAGVQLSAAAPTNDRVTVIVPAHNESRVITHLVESLKCQDYPHVRFILALDRCTDSTKELALSHIAGDPRFVIHEITECPPEWAGKVHAVHAAVKHAGTLDWQTDALLFSDADARFAPEAIRATVAVLRQRNLQMLSLMTTLSSDLWFERIVQPAASLEIARMFPTRRTNAATNRRGFANGQFMLFDKAAYESFGGHAAVKDAILEDLALARLMAAQERPTQVLFADGLVRVHMYDRFSSFRAGWKRIFIECTDWKTSRLTRYAWIMLLLSSILPLWTLGLLILGIAVKLSGHHVEPMFDTLLPAAGIHARASTLALGLGLWAYSIYLVTLALMYRLAGTRLLYVLTHPVGAWIVAGILLDAARDVRNHVPIRWGGREYSRAPK